MDRMTFLNLKYSTIFRKSIRTGAIVLIVLFTGLVAMSHSSYSFKYNGTESINKGLYIGTKVSNKTKLSRGDLACFKYSAPEWASDRNYFPDGFTLCKKIAAVPSDSIIDGGSSIIVADSKGSALALYPKAALKDSRQRLTVLSDFYGNISSNKVYLVGSNSNRSMDSRYLGPVDSDRLTHTLTPLITVDYNSKSLILGRP